MNRKLSIVTINYNNLEGLKKTFDSVLSQTWKGFEHIVIDGGSTDGSVEFLKSLGDDVNWVSEPDNGVYHAMNKGIGKASGEYLLYLNSGDHFYNNKVLEKYNDTITEKDIIYFNLQVIDKNKTFIKEYPNTMSFSYFVYETLPHPATFIKKELFEKLGFYDEELKIVSDWKWFMDAICKNNASYKKIDATLSTFYLDGMSSNPENRSIKYEEIQQVLRNDYSAYIRDIDDILVNNEIILNLRKSRIIKLFVKLGFLNKF